MTIFGKILLGLILITAVVLIIKGGNKTDDSDLVNSDDDTDSEAMTDDTKADNLFNGSMKDLIARGGDYKCTFSHSTDVSDSSGTVYVSGQKMRGDFTSNEKVSGTTSESHMINDGEFSYVWSSAMPMGLKMKITNDTTAGADTTSGVDVNQKLDYSCEKWNGDASQFSLPASVNFTELPQA